MAHLTTGGVSCYNCGKISLRRRNRGGGREGKRSKSNAEKIEKTGKRTRKPTKEKGEIWLKRSTRLKRSRQKRRKFKREIASGPAKPRTTDF